MDALVSCSWLAQNICRSDIKIADIRGIVKRQEVSPGVVQAEYLPLPAEFEAGHIPGAQFIDWVAELIDWHDAKTGFAARPDQVEAIFRRLGVNEGDTVVACDADGGMFASRFWWTAQYYSFTRVCILEGGYNAWLKNGYAIENGPALETRSTSSNPPKLVADSSWRFNREQILRELSGGNVQIIDVRDEKQYKSETKRSKRGGRIPGAKSVPKEAVFGPNGYIPLDELHELLRAQEIDLNRPIVAYCNGGVAATTLLHALHRLGAKAIANYDGSWNEWGNREDTPIENES